MLVQFTIFPTDQGESVSGFVASAIKIVEDSGLPYKLGPMSTSIEGEWGEILAVINRCRKELRKRSKRVYIVISVDDREGASGRIEGKIRDVAEKLGHEPKT
ncbi:MTH1187 family thiamine-binding protein [candidate division WOR-3 bacterium]|uniref:MTH1187 family thiamine-binding protein n=1 Tax=candidate division WOR-3 bacterium TaxID=2052148 RepID=A0A9D5QD78_UNCW3|nr:MTH1187 family thiamine-binding protein [candidate division WOR-3 bacterium]MBD3364827.1 MTH1187 family thiamine-binding protein [candidate division WOR-3 bacterium]